MSGGIQVIVSKSIIVDHNPLVVCCGICKDTIVPLGLDNRLPEDTLFMIFEEDFRFFPEGQDPDGADDYSERVMQLIMERGFEALKGSESLPPQSQNSSSSSLPRRKLEYKNKYKISARIRISIRISKRITYNV